MKEKSGVIERTFRGIVLRAEHHLHRPGPNTPFHHPLPHLSQSGTRIQLSAILPIGILSPRPEDFCCCARTWPYHVVEIQGIRLFGPDVHLASYDEMLLCGGDAGQRVVRVDQAPILVRRAVICEGVESLVGLAFGEV